MTGGENAAAHHPREFNGIGHVAMQANGLRRNLNPRSVRSFESLSLDQRQGARGNQFRITRQAGALQDDITFVVVLEVDISFVYEPDASRLALSRDHLAGHYQHEITIDRFNRPDDTARGCWIVDRSEIQLPMRLDVVEAHAFRAAETEQRADLVDADLENLVFGKLHSTPAEASKVRIRYMRTEFDAVLLRKTHGAGHRPWVSRVIAAGHMHRGDEGHQRLIVAENVTTEGFAHIGVEIDLHGATSLLPPRSASPQQSHGESRAAGRICTDKHRSAIQLASSLRSAADLQVRGTGDVAINSGSYRRRSQFAQSQGIRLDTGIS